MKKLIMTLTILFTPPTWADDPRYYTEYKNEWNVTDAWNYKSTQQFLRFGIEFDKWYAEVGPMYSGAGELNYSSEVGYKFKITDRLQLKGKFETKDAGSKLETEFRYYFH